jgi:hypothetical protein
MALVSSNTPVGTAHAGSTATISVNAGDFLFAFASSNGLPANWSASTQSPSNTHSIANAADPNSLVDGSSADWLVASTNASFSVSVSAVSASVVAANWR